MLWLCESTAWRENLNTFRYIRHKRWARQRQKFKQVWTLSTFSFTFLLWKRRTNRSEFEVRFFKIMLAAYSYPLISHGFTGLLCECDAILTRHTASVANPAAGSWQCPSRRPLRYRGQPRASGPDDGPETGDGSVAVPRIRTEYSQQNTEMTSTATRQTGQLSFNRPATLPAMYQSCTYTVKWASLNQGERNPTIAPTASANA